jgi:hypothetical protein
MPQNDVTRKSLCGFKGCTQLPGTEGNVIV